MNQPDTNENAPGSAGKNLIVSGLIGAAAAAVILMLFVLPAEYGVDPTGIGAALGLTEMNETAEPTRTFEIAEVVGGNETVFEVEVPDFGEPVALPNPAVHQEHDAPPRSETVEVTIGAERETEIKTVLRQGQVLTYSWSTDRGTIYSDFHGHDPLAGNEYWVRYREHQEGAASHSGSLVAPFEGEHGWYWLNYNDYPVTVTLTLTGYYDDILDYSANFR